MATQPTEEPALSADEPAASDDQLLRAARRGDGASFAALVERHDPALHHLAAALLDDVGVDQALITSYVRAYRSMGRATGGTRAWLGRTTYLTCLDEVRRRDRRRLGGPGRKPDRAVPTGDDPLVAAMAPDERAARVLVDVVGMDEDEAAATLGAEPAALARLVARARAVAPPGELTVDHPPVGHDDGFWALLGQRLLAARDAPAAAVPRLPDPAAASPAAGPAAPPPVAMQRRAPRAARARREPDPVDGLATGAKRRRVRTRPLVLAARVLAALVVLGLVAGGVVAVVRLASRAKAPVRENSVAELSGRVADTLAADTLSARITRTVDGGSGPRSVSYRLLRNRAGSYVLSGVDIERSVAYDAPSDTRRERTVTSTGAEPTVAASEERGLAAGPPDAAPGDPALPDAELGLALRTLGTVDDEAAAADTDRRVAVWRLEADLPGGGDGRPDRVVLLVDKAGLTPRLVEFRAGDRVVRSVRFDELALDGPAPGPFTVDLSADPVTPIDRGFRTVQLGQVEAELGRAPLRPAYLPAGFELAAVTVRDEGRVTSLRYQRGVEEVVVTTRDAPGGAQRWADPFPRPAGDWPSEGAPIEQGPFRGVVARLVTAPGTEASLWGSDGEIAFTVAGDLNADDLVKVAESLR